LFYFASAARPTCSPWPSAAEEESRCTWTIDALVEHAQVAKDFATSPDNLKRFLKRRRDK